MQITRRKLLSLSLGGASLLAWNGWQSHQPISRRSWALGSEVSMTVVGLSPSVADRALDAAFRELEVVEQIMSLYRPDSQISRLNRDRLLHRPHPYLIDVLEEAEQTARQSDGAFDVTVQSLWQLFAAGQKESCLPTASEIDAARLQVDWTKVIVSQDRVTLLEPVTAITLNGIAQGFAADRAVAALRDHGVEHALINTGEIAGLGQNSNGRDWTIGIQHPRQPDAFVSVAALQNRSLATSGDYETTFSAGFSTNHIFDPRTGRSPSDLASVSIVAPTAMQADALSTAAMVLGPDRTLAMIETMPGIDALLILKQGRAIRTAGFPLS